MKPEIIVALDTSDFDLALEWIEEIPAKTFKVGLEAIYAGILDEVIDEIRQKGAKLFFDAKLSDTPTTVRKATKAIIDRYSPEFLTVREGVLEATQQALGTNTIIIDVPQLTSSTPGVQYFYHQSPGLVCHPWAAITYRQLQPDKIIVCPGVRLAGDPQDDDWAPWEIPKDADYIVVGRQITQSANPLAAYERYMEAIEALYEHQ